MQSMAPLPKPGYEEQHSASSPVLQFSLKHKAMETRGVGGALAPVQEKRLRSQQDSRKRVNNFAEARRHGSLVTLMRG